MSGGTTGWAMLHEAAPLAGVSKNTLGRWANLGLIPDWAMFKVGKTRHRYSRAWCIAQGGGTAAGPVTVERPGTPSESEQAAACR